MKQYNFDCWELLTIDGDGRGSTHAGYASNRDTALEWKNEQPIWREFRAYKNTMIIVDSMEEIRSIESNKKKIAALNKLTAEEISLLNIDTSGIFE